MRTPSIAKIANEFPEFPRLHGFWRSIPSFNPHVVSSHPDQEFEADAAALLFPAGTQQRSNRTPDALEREGSTAPMDLTEEQQVHTSMPDPDPAFSTRSHTFMDDSWAMDTHNAGPPPSQASSSRHVNSGLSFPPPASQSAFSDFANQPGPSNYAPWGSLTDFPRFEPSILSPPGLATSRSASSHIGSSITATPSLSTRRSASPRFHPYARQTSSSASAQSQASNLQSSNQFIPSPITPITPTGVGSPASVSVSASRRPSVAPNEARSQQRSSTSGRGRGTSAPPIGHSRAGNISRQSRVEQAQSQFDDVAKMGEQVVHRKKEREHERLMKDAEIKLAKYKMEDYRLQISKESLELEKHKTERLRQTQEHAERMISKQIELERLRIRSAMIRANPGPAQIEPPLPAAVDDRHGVVDDADQDFEDFED